MFRIKTKKIAIIGAGPSGLVSAKYAVEQGHECDVFEQKGTHGGVWAYIDQTGIDENGVPIHSAMYEDLRTNLPKEVMEFLDFPYPEQTKSYIPQSEVVDYLNSYVDQFKLQSFIKYYKCVTKIKPLPEEKWIVTVQDVKTKIEESKIYDSVFICNGHYREPVLPELPGQDIFEGPQWHSEIYRNPEPFKNKTVLIMGCGPSAQEIAKLILNVTKKVYFSRRPGALLTGIPENVIGKPIITKLNRNGGVFADGTEEEFDLILYCTGYKYSFPFLTEDCGIKVDDNWVHPLYKHIINIEHPTMYFIGIPYIICIMPMFDLQARFALAALEGKFTLPSKENMLKELEEYMTERKKHNIPIKKAHLIGKSEQQEAYYRNLAETAGIKNIPIVVTKIYAKLLELLTWNRNFSFKIIDDENFLFRWDEPQ